MVSTLLRDPQALSSDLASFGTLELWYSGMDMVSIKFPQR